MWKSSSIVRTSSVADELEAASIGAGATYLFWRYQKSPTWTRVVLTGLALGLAQLTKFSLILLYGFWPALAVLRFVLDRDWQGWPRRVAIGLASWSTPGSRWPSARSC